MLKPEKSASVTLIMGALLVALSACQKQEGPAEQFVKEVDQATEKVGEQVEKAGDNIQGAVKDDKD